MMKKSGKTNLLIVLLIAAFIAGTLPVFSFPEASAFAETEQSPVVQDEPGLSAVELCKDDDRYVEISLTSSPGIRCVYDTSKCAIYFEGEGEISDYEVGEKPEWSAYSNKIKMVCVLTSVSAIGANAFANMPSLYGVYLPSTLTYIGENAFLNDSKLLWVSGASLFDWCWITFENKYSNPLFYAKNLYWGNEKVTDLDFDEENIREINSYAFINANIDTITSSAVTIGALAFENCKVQTLNIAEGTKIIPEAAFANCVSLSALNLPSTLEEIEEAAFCNCKSLPKGNLFYNECKYKLSKIKISPLNDAIDLDNFTWMGRRTDAIPATCTMAGMTEGWRCDDCNVVIVTPEAIKPTGHFWENWGVQTTELHVRNCTACGIYEKLKHTFDKDNRCTVCGYELGTPCSHGVCLKAESLPAGSRFVVSVYDNNGKMKSCRMERWTGKFDQQWMLIDSVVSGDAVSLLVCDKNYSPIRDICKVFMEGDAADNFSFTETVTTEPTCTLGGISKVDCSLCEEGDDFEWTIPPLQHNMVSKAAIAATCTMSGLTEGRCCDRCGEISIAQKKIPMIKHIWKAATCTSPAFCIDCCRTSGSAVEHDYNGGNKCRWCGTSKAAEIELNFSEFNLVLGYTDQLKITCTPAGYKLGRVNWSSSNPDNVSVDENGYITGNATGEAIITAEVDGLEANCTVTVHKPDLMAVINCDASTEESVQASFEVEEVDSDEDSNLAGVLSEDGAYDIEESDDADDNSLFESKVHTTHVTYSEEARAYVDSLKEQAALGLSSADEKKEYQIGDKKYMIDYDGELRQQECIYIGEHCTLWKSTSDKYALTESTAKKMAEEFDDKFDEEISYFGTWYDADADGKLAILVNDFSQYADYKPGTSHNLVGFLAEIDLVDVNGCINGHKKNWSYTCQMDCIHINSYRTIYDENGKELENLDDVYSTLYHEFQHLINFSYSVLDSYTYDSMETYLDEAMAMAAEHLIMGPDVVKPRIEYFNGEIDNEYKCGSSLTYWDYNDFQHNYSNSYLFGQYIRTQYAQMPGVTDGALIYKAILQERHKRHGGDSLPIVAELLDVTEEDLLCNFWTALYLNDKEGVNGFNGENWAEYINPQAYNTFEDTTSDIGSGGCKYYFVDSAVQANTDYNLKFIYMWK